MDLQTVLYQIYTKREWIDRASRDDLMLKLAGAAARDPWYATNDRVAVASVNAARAHLLSIPVQETMETEDA